MSVVHHGGHSLLLFMGMANYLHARQNVYAGAQLTHWTMSERPIFCRSIGHSIDIKLRASNIKCAYENRHEYFLLLFMGHGRLHAWAKCLCRHVADPPNSVGKVKFLSLNWPQCRHKIMSSHYQVFICGFKCSSHKKYCKGRMNIFPLHIQLNACRTKDYWCWQ